MVSRGLFGWSPPHIQPLTPVSEVSEPPESPFPYLDSTSEPIQLEDDEEEIEPPQAAVPFSRLFSCADGFDWVLMVVGSLVVTAHGSSLVVYLHFFRKKGDSEHRRVKGKKRTRWGSVENGEEDGDAQRIQASVSRDGDGLESRSMLMNANDR